MKTFPPGAIFCRTCGYCLYGLPSHRCPECGHDFDPADRKTFLARPRRVWVRRTIVWGMIVVLMLAAAYGALLGWLYWGWKAEAGARGLIQWGEEQAKADSSVEFLDVSQVKKEPLLPAGWHWLILPACRPWMERVSSIAIGANRRPPDLAERLLACRWIRTLTLHGLPLERRDVAAISHLSELSELHLWDGGNGQVLDDQALATIARLRNLEVLGVDNTCITDRGLDALANLPNLRELYLYDPSALTDKAVDALCRYKGLKKLQMDNVALSQAGIDRLKAGLPGCKVRVPVFFPPATAPASSPAAP